MTTFEKVAIGLAVGAFLFMLFQASVARHEACVAAGGHYYSSGRNGPICVSDEGRILEIR